MSNHPFLNEQHEAFREQVRRFTAKEIIPNIDTWEEAGILPDAFQRKLGDAGFLGLGFAEELGGTPMDDPFYEIILTEEICRAGSGGVIASGFTHGIAIPPIVAMGTDEQKQRFVPPVLRGEKVAALCVTEPSGGSDVANLETRAQLSDDGNHYIINGSKTFITSGMRADYYTVAVRTGGHGMGGVSLLMVEKDTAGFTQTSLQKMGWRCSDTATLYFDNCHVPVTNRIGPENAGFMGIMLNFNNERLALAAQAYGLAQCAWEEARDWAQQRETFGKPLIKHQVIKHKLVDMRMRINAVYSLLMEVAHKVQHKQVRIEELCMLKNLATETCEKVAGDAVQILGGAGYMQGAKCERIFRETKVLSIGGGATEVMADLAARQFGW